MKGINIGEIQHNTINKVAKRKDYREWTDDLHDKFMKAVEQLGKGRCYPMEILEVMNFPGLTRMQVAIHLQKCRRNNWRSPKERKYIRHLSRHQSSTVSHEPRSIHRRFGTITCLQVNIPNQQSNPDQIQRDQEFSVLEFSVPTLCTNNIFSGGESTIQ